LRVEIDKIQF